MTLNNPTTYSLQELAQIAFDSYYKDDLDTFEKLGEYLNGYDLHDNTMQNLEDALLDDIADLIHNRNEADLFPFLDDLEEHIADDLIDYLNDEPAETLIENLARLILDALATTTKTPNALSSGNTFPTTTSEL